jgi:hypothetical protein
MGNQLQKSLTNMGNQLQKLNKRHTIIFFFEKKGEGGRIPIACHWWRRRPSMAVAHGGGDGWRRDFG